MIYFLLLVAASASYLLKKLTLAGAITGLIIAIAITAGTGYTGITILAAFFVLSVLATQTKGERRTAGQVLANGGVPAIISLVAFIDPLHIMLYQLMLAGSLASATADTLSSELGTKYGRSFFNIITFKPGDKGLDGVVSLEGTLIGLAGATVIAITYCLFNGWGISLVYIIAAGFIGNIADSILGATLEQRSIIGNNMVNFLNTTVGAGVCVLISVICNF